jgi:hypothetical protein
MRLAKPPHFHHFSADSAVEPIHLTLAPVWIRPPPLFSHLSLTLSQSFFYPSSSLRQSLHLVLCQPLSFGCHENRHSLTTPSRSFWIVRDTPNTATDRLNWIDSRRPRSITRLNIQQQGGLCLSFIHCYLSLSRQATSRSSGLIPSKTPSSTSSRATPSRP